MLKEVNQTYLVIKNMERDNGFAVDVVLIELL